MGPDPVVAPTVLHYVEIQILVRQADHRARDRPLAPAQPGIQIGAEGFQMGSDRLAVGDQALTVPQHRQLAMGHPPRIVDDAPEDVLASAYAELTRV